MKTVLSLCLLVFFNACWGQKNVPMEFEKFDVETYKKNENKGLGLYSFTLPDGTEVVQSESELHFSHTETPPDPEMFEIYKEFYKNTFIQKKGKFFKKGNWEKGVWYYFDREGNLIEKKDHDKPFKNFPWEKVTTFMVTNGIPMEQIWGIERQADEKGAFWYISWIKDTKTKMGEIITIDANTGKVIKKQEQSFAREI
ncbi:hypothetical protein LS482_16105 [Sinomicrobium kalidii]|uniref:hypothetical protein n=1 Tax=Sinomicrobium kalidii TaxID=2900738 RepID=UPI001E49D420|nr:hypothetical protein [Sinomicrobium kalidii]UGU15196.1 hypothetical protein LS482_16105 [Sinomicrobium kalidii]